MPGLISRKCLWLYLGRTSWHYVGNAGHSNLYSVGQSDNTHFNATHYGVLTGFIEVVTNSRFGDNILWLRWVWLYLVAQMPDVDA